MNTKELIEELQKLPKDYELCVRDSYGAFQDFNFITKGHTIERRYNDAGETKRFYVLETHYDHEGYRWNENPVKEIKLEPVYEYQEEIDDILGVIGGKHYRFNSETKLNQWEPSISGGSGQDKIDMKNLNDDYWWKLCTLFCYHITLDKLKTTTLLGAAAELYKINNSKA